MSVIVVVNSETIISLGKQMDIIGVFMLHCINSTTCWCTLYYYTTRFYIKQFDATIIFSSTLENVYVCYNLY